MIVDVAPALDPSAEAPAMFMASTHKVDHQIDTVRRPPAGGVTIR